MSEIKKQNFEKKLSGLKKEQKQKIMLAYKFAELGHKGQLRDEGGPYFEHPKRAALILIDELNIVDSYLLVAEMIAAELLHDIKEDSSILTWEEIELFFGIVVRVIVETLTKDKSLPKQERDEKYIEKLKNADVVIKIVKLADRLDNLRTLKGCDEKKQLHIIQETQEHYLPMAKEISPYIFEKMQEIIKNFGFTDSGIRIKNILSFSIPCGYEGCNKEAIHIDVDERSGKVKVINREGTLKAEDVKRLIYLLQDDISKADAFLRDLMQGGWPIFKDGMRNFCTQCNCAYCNDHHCNTEEGYEGRFDYEFWICPNGHKHIVDD